MKASMGFRIGNLGFEICGGSDFTGELGLGQSPSTDTMCQSPNVSAPLRSNLVPRVVPNLGNIITVHVARGVSFFAVAADGRLYGWGNGDQAPFGDGATTPRYTPALVPGITGVRAIADSYDATFALRNDGSIWGWGNNRGGGLNDGTQTLRAAPAPVPGVGRATELIGDGLMHEQPKFPSFPTTAGARTVTFAFGGTAALPEPVAPGT